jgi:hypothetical protein
MQIIVKNEKGELVSRQVTDTPVDIQAVTAGIKFHLEQLEKLRAILAGVTEATKDDPASPLKDAVAEASVLIPE